MGGRRHMPRRIAPMSEEALCALRDLQGEPLDLDTPSRPQGSTSPDAPLHPSSAEKEATSLDTSRSRVTVINVRERKTDNEAAYEYPPDIGDNKVTERENSVKNEREHSLPLKLDRRRLSVVESSRRMERPPLRGSQTQRASRSKPAARSPRNDVRNALRPKAARSDSWHAGNRSARNNANSLSVADTSAKQERRKMYRSTQNVTQEGGFFSSVEVVEGQMREDSGISVESQAPRESDHPAGAFYKGNVLPGRTAPPSIISLPSTEGDRLSDNQVHKDDDSLSSADKNKNLIDRSKNDTDRNKSDTDRNKNDTKLAMTSSTERVENRHRLSKDGLNANADIFDGLAVIRTGPPELTASNSDLLRYAGETETRRNAIRVSASSAALERSAASFAHRNPSTAPRQNSATGATTSKSSSNSSPGSGSLVHTTNPQLKSTRSGRYYAGSNVPESWPVSSRFPAAVAAAAAAAARSREAAARREEEARAKELALMRIRQHQQLEEQARYFRVSAVGYDCRYEGGFLPAVEDVDEDELVAEEELRLRAVSKCQAWLNKHYVASAALN